jgi:hypothetical protein
MGRTIVAVVSIGLALGWSRGASAQPDGPRMDEYTAFTVEDGQLKLGILAFEYGITDRLSVGTDPPAWAAGAVVDAWAPNLHLKYTLLAREHVRLTGQVAGYLANLSAAGAEGSTLVVVPLTGLVSVKLADRWWVHLEGNYNFIDATGTIDFDRAEIGGVVSTESAQVGAMLEFRPTPKLALTLRGRYQAWMRPLSIRGDSQIDPYTRADVQAEMVPSLENPYSVVASVSYFWRHLHARVGGGYGTYFIPGANLYLPYTGFIPDASLALVF